MKRSPCLPVAALSAALLLSFSASAHDPKEFDRMLDAAPARADTSACAKLDALGHGKTKPAAAELKSLRARCDVEKKAELKMPSTGVKAPDRT